MLRFGTVFIILASFIIALLMPSPSLAEPLEQVWGTAQDDVILDIAKTADGGCAVAGVQASSAIPLQGTGYLARFNAAGSLLWTRSSEAFDAVVFHSLCQLADGGFAVVGNGANAGGTWHGYLLRTDAAGDTLWTRDFSADFDCAPRRVRELADQSLLVSGHRLTATNDWDLFVLHLDASGDTIATRTMGTSNYDQGMDMAALADGAIVLAGLTDHGRNGRGTEDMLLSLRGSMGSREWATEEGYIICLDSGLNTLWEAIVPHDLYLRFEGVEAAGPARALAGGLKHISDAPYNDDYVFAMIDATPGGGIEWLRSSERPFDEVCWGLGDAAGGLFFAAGNAFWTEAQPADAAMSLVDVDGEVLATQTYGGGDWDQFHAAQPTTGRGFFAGGSTNSQGAGAADFFLVRDEFPALADFTAPVRSGPDPLEVQFHDISTVAGSGWAWDFNGDEVIDATEQNPSFTYGSPGIYSVSLEVTAGMEVFSRLKAGYVLVGQGLPPVQADFGAYPTELHVDGTVQFHDHSQGLPSFWSWDLDGDGQIDSYARNPSHVYDAPGSYAVSLTVSNGESQDTMIVEDCISVWDNGNPLDDYSGTQFEHIASGTFPSYSPAAVSDDRLGLGNSWHSLDWREGEDFPHWVQIDFGDAPRAINNLSLLVFTGGWGARLKDFELQASQDGVAFESLTANPMTYESQAGWQFFDFDNSTAYRYYRLYGLNNWSSDPFEATQMIIEEWELGNSLAAGFTALPLAGQPPLQVHFTDTTVGGPVGWEWDFENDGNVDSGAQNPTHTYEAPGAYSVRLSVTDGQVSDDLVKPAYIHVLEAGFSMSTASGPAPWQVAFSDESLGEPDAWSWDFDSDGVSDASTPHPTHTYTEPGVYSVTLIASYGSAADTLTKTGCVTALASNNMIIRRAEILSSNPAPLPFEYLGAEALGAISIYLDYDDTKIAYAGIESYVPGETFFGGVIGGKISVQWFDETGGSDPIIPGEDADTLFAVLVTHLVTADSTQIEFDESLCALGGPTGNPLSDVAWLDDPPYGVVLINIGAIVSGRVGYYWQDAAVPGALLSMGPPNPDVLSDALGLYQFESYPYGNYVLSVAKDDDLGGINSLDAIKVIRHSTGQEPFNNAYKNVAADVNEDQLINALDAIKIVRDAVGLENLPSGDWTFDPESVVLAPLTQDREENFIAIRMGDTNGDWAPSGRERDAKHDGRDGIVLALPDTTVSPAAGLIELPLTVEEFTGVGAISLRIAIADSVLDFEQVISHVSGVSFTYNAVGDEIRIEWFDPTGGLNPIVMGNGTLLGLVFTVVGEDNDVSPLHFTSACAIGDAFGDPIAGVAYLDGSCTLSTSVGVDEPLIPAYFRVEQNFPNPFNPTTELRFSLPEPASVSAQVFDLAGRRVRVLLQDASYLRGVHGLIWDGRDDDGRPSSSGVYLLRLEAGMHSSTVKMLLMK